MHRTRVQNRTVRKAITHWDTTTSRTGMEWVGEWIVVCDKCGLVDKAPSHASAEIRAARHNERPHQ